MTEVAKDNQKGFTLVELLLAMSVFSFVLIMASATFIQINRLYVKSNIVAQTQAQTRAVMEDVVRTIRLADSRVVVHKASPNNRSYCIGNTTYTYSLDGAFGDGSVSFVKAERSTGSYEFSQAGELYSAAIKCGNEALGVFGAASFGSGNVTQLLDDGFVVREFDIYPLVDENDFPIAYQVSITISHGDDDSFEEGAPDGASTTCSGDAASSTFCAVSRLQTTVYRRIR